MRNNWKKIVVLFLIVISIVNIGCIIWNYIEVQEVPYYYGNSRLFSYISAVVILALQILNIVLSCKILKNYLNVENKILIKKLLVIISIFIITFLIPLSSERSTYIDYNKRNEGLKTGNLLLDYVTETTVYKNIYLIDIFTNKYTTNTEEIY